jgi:hypothetical protein
MLKKTCVVNKKKKSVNNFFQGGTYTNNNIQTEEIPTLSAG